MLTNYGTPTQLTVQLKALLIIYNLFLTSTEFFPCFQFIIGYIHLADDYKRNVTPYTLVYESKCKTSKR